MYTEPSELGRWVIIWIILEEVEEEKAAREAKGGEKKKECCSKEEKRGREKKKDILELSIQANPKLSPSLEPDSEKVHIYQN